MKKYIKHWQKYNLDCATTTVFWGRNTDYNYSEKIKESFTSTDKIVFAGQSHSNNVKYADGRIKTYKNTDGLLTKRKGVMLAVRTADCLPVFFYDDKNKFAGIAHAGWKGLLNNIILNFIKVFLEKGGSLHNLNAYIGPHIKRNCYEIGSDLVDIFTAKFADDKIIKKSNNKHFLDLTLIAYNQLVSTGIYAKKISISPFCTYCNELFFSLRRHFHTIKDKVNYGEMLSYIKIK